MKLIISLLIWVLGWIGLFVLLELLAIFWKGCPWYTLSRTSWHLIRWWPPLAFVFLLGLVVLAVHIFEGGKIKLGAFARRRA